MVGYDGTIVEADLPELCFLCQNEDAEWCQGCKEFICHNHPWGTVFGGHDPHDHNDFGTELIEFEDD